MAAVHGKDGAVLFDEYDLSAYLTQVSMGKQSQAVNITTFGNDDKVYLPGLGEGSVSLQGIWDGDAGASDVVLDAAVGANAVITVGLGALSAVGNPTIMLRALDASYQQRATVNDAVRITANATANGGIRVAGRVLQPLEAETTTFDGTSVDNGASSAFGGVGHIHVTAFSGTSATVKIQDSANDSSWADLITFANVTGVGAERLLVAGQVDQYLRFSITADNFTSMTIACSFARNRRA
jgi:hypothetical protein